MYYDYKNKYPGIGSNEYSNLYSAKHRLTDVFERASFVNFRYRAIKRIGVQILAEIFLKNSAKIVEGNVMHDIQHYADVASFLEDYKCLKRREFLRYLKEGALQTLYDAKISTEIEGGKVYFSSTSCLQRGYINQSEISAIFVRTIIINAIKHMLDAHKTDAIKSMLIGKRRGVHGKEDNRHIGREMHFPFLHEFLNGDKYQTDINVDNLISLLTMHEDSIVHGFEYYYDNVAKRYGAMAHNLRSGSFFLCASITSYTTRSLSCSMDDKSEGKFERRGVIALARYWVCYNAVHGRMSGLYRKCGLEHRAADIAMNATILAASACISYKYNSIISKLQLGCVIAAVCFDYALKSLDDSLSENELKI